MNLYSENSFWYCVNILITKSHVVNNRLWGSKTIFRGYGKPVCNPWESLAVYSDSIKSITTSTTNSIQLFLEKLKLQECNEGDTDAIEIICLELLPKSYCEPHGFQLVCIQRAQTAVTFYPLEASHKLCPTLPYMIQLNNDEILLKYEDVNSKSFTWLKETVLSHFRKWFNEYLQSNRQQTCNQSLSLVSNESYYEKYNKLKLKYGKEMVKIWPECTDPSKFVYEDIAIATYLLLLWEDERRHSKINNLQTFVDLGCGNGLLVYILNMEGHCGKGVDVRKRQIWSIYPTEVKLEERTIVPSDTHLFPEADWIIGNHSDELTPWIPVIAAQSSYRCNFFLLPCCAFNFDGTKYQRKNSSKSQYNEYLETIQKICEDCGYYTNKDRLKIPSTKRICLVGRGRIHSEEEYPQYCTQIKNLINNGITVRSNNQSNGLWIEDFKAREATERIRNCTSLEKSLVDLMVQTIFSYLLEECNLETHWCPGRIVEIRDIAKILPQDKLKALKSEFGGLQTLLKNNHHIFKVQNGKVHLRYPKTIEETTIDLKNKKKTVKLSVKQKPCWFNNHHPQGCPLNEIDCSYLHIEKKNIFVNNNFYP